ncbi:hypothetical protein [Oceaniglobus roseus]|uniref:hypothetical protein n=1 Tax=Oceaniglobus roseus TaxID=1737570 RepID=UPI000C7E9407|nr:hypothetical protein [Kandeliimicrobium roseum]
MTFAALSEPLPRPGPLFAEPRLAAFGLLLTLSLVLTLAAAALDPRQFQGDSVWLKPIKFQVALAIYVLSLAVFARWLPAGMQESRGYRLYIAVVIFTILAELAWIGGAALFGTASHYNVSSPLMERLYGLMGVFAVTLTSASLVFGIAIWRNAATGLSPALQTSIALGLVGTFLLTLPIAGTLASLPGHFVGTPATGAALPVLGWSREVGDLRAPHFLATHTMHALPLAGLAAHALLPAGGARTATWAAAAAWTAFVLLTFAVSLAGLPLIPLP